MTSSLIEDLFYNYNYIIVASITTLWVSELINFTAYTYTSLAQCFPIDPKVEPSTWLLLENPVTLYKQQFYWIMTLYHYVDLYMYSVIELQFSRTHLEIE